MADLIPFPLHARSNLVLSIVDELSLVHGEEANEFWRNRIAGIVAELRSSGAADPAIREEILNLQHAVQSELFSRSQRTG